jgi:hypothetical protein
MINKKQMGMNVKRSDYGTFVAPLLQFHGGMRKTTEHLTHNRQSQG